MEVFSQAVGFVLGIVGSFIGWWILFHGISPKLKFSTSITRIKADEEPGGVAYRVKFENPGRRAIVDLTLLAKLRIQGLNRESPGNFEITYLPTSFSGEFPLILSVRRKGTRHLTRIRADKPSEFQRQIYPEGIRRKAKDHTLTLDDLLSIGEKATVQIIAFGSDSFSGSRKVFFSPEYTIDSITSRPFKRHSLAVDERETNDMPPVT